MPKLKIPHKILLNVIENSPGCHRNSRGKFKISKETHFDLKRNSKPHDIEAKKTGVSVYENRGLADQYINEYVY